MSQCSFKVVKLKLSKLRSNACLFAVTFNRCHKLDVMYSQCFGSQWKNKESAADFYLVASRLKHESQPFKPKLVCSLWPADALCREGSDVRGSEQPEGDTENESGLTVRRHQD